MQLRSEVDQFAVDLFPEFADLMTPGGERPFTEGWTASHEQGYKYGVLGCLLRTCSTFLSFADCDDVLDEVEALLSHYNRESRVPLVRLIGEVLGAFIVCLEQRDFADPADIQELKALKESISDQNN